MTLSFRIDLDYLPWNEVDAKEFGHSGPATTLRVLEWARRTGLKLSFFATLDHARAFPTVIDAVLNEGHDLDWLADDPEGWPEASAFFARFGHQILGLATPTAEPCKVPDGCAFVCATPQNDRQALEAGTPFRSWIGGLKTTLHQSRKLDQALIIALHPPILGKFDPSLAGLQDLQTLAALKTVREVLLGHS